MSLDDGPAAEELIIGEGHHLALEGAVRNKFNNPAHRARLWSKKKMYYNRAGKILRNHLSPGLRSLHLPHRCYYLVEQLNSRADGNETAKNRQGGRQRVQV